MLAAERREQWVGATALQEEQVWRTAVDAGGVGGEVGVGWETDDGASGRATAGSAEAAAECSTSGGSATLSEGSATGS